MHPPYTGGGVTEWEVYMHMLRDIARSSHAVKHNNVILTLRCVNEILYVAAVCSTH